jgi:hypothetical protein
MAETMTIHKEGQRQYTESLGLVTDGLTRPPTYSIQRPLPVHQRGPVYSQSQPAL